MCAMLSDYAVITGDRFDHTYLGTYHHQQQYLKFVLHDRAQILNIAAGGDMYQDMYDQIDRQLLQHSQKASRTHSTHYVDVVHDTLLHEITQQDVIRVNSDHHQANRKIANGFLVCGKASDGIIEAIESKQHRFVLGVQWHPENMAVVEDDMSLKIYEAFINACQQ